MMSSVAIEMHLTYESYLETYESCLEPFILLQENNNNIFRYHNNNLLVSFTLFFATKS